MSDESNAVDEFDPGTCPRLRSKVAAVAEQAPYLFCDACGFYPIEPVHGHFVCPSCKLPTKCCEGGPMEL